MKSLFFRCVVTLGAVIVFIAGMDRCALAGIVGSLTQVDASSHNSVLWDQGTHTYDGNGDPLTFRYGESDAFLDDVRQFNGPGSASVSAANGTTVLDRFSVFHDYQTDTYSFDIFPDAPPPNGIASASVTVTNTSISFTGIAKSGTVVPSQDFDYATNSTFVWFETYFSLDHDAAFTLNDTFTGTSNNLLILHDNTTYEDVVFLFASEDAKNTYTGTLYSGHQYALFKEIYDSGDMTGTAELTLADISAVPEPSSIVMLTFGGIGMGLAAWRRRRVAVA